MWLWRAMELGIVATDLSGREDTRYGGTHKPPPLEASFISWHPELRRLVKGPLLQALRRIWHDELARRRPIS